MERTNVIKSHSAHGVFAADSYSVAAFAANYFGDTNATHKELVAFTNEVDPESDYSDMSDVDLIIANCEWGREYSDFVTFVQNRIKWEGWV